MSVLEAFFDEHRFALGGLAALGAGLFLGEEIFGRPTDSKLCSGARMIRILLLVAVLTAAVNFALLIPLPYKPVDLSGKTFLVTGCTPGGIGEASARELLAWNASRVICTMRSPEKAEALLASIVRQGPGKVETVVLELTSFDSVRRAAQEIRTRFPQLDGVLLNAGLMTSERRITPDGFEEMYQTNHLSQFLLLRLLQDRLRPSGRVSFVSSSSYFFLANLDKDVYGSKPGGRTSFSESFAQWLTYTDTKLMNILTANVFARRLAKDGIRVNSVCPGLVRTGFASRMPQDSVSRFLEEIIHPLVARNTHQGAQRPLDTLVNAETTAFFFDPYLPMPLLPQINEENEEWLYETSSKLVGLDV